MVRHKSILDAIETEDDVAVFGGRGSDGVGAGDFFAFGSIGFYREPLSRHESELIDAIYLEFDVFSEVGEWYGMKHASLKRCELSH